MDRTLKVMLSNAYLKDENPLLTVIREGALYLVDVPSHGEPKPSRRGSR